MGGFEDRGFGSGWRGGDETTSRVERKVSKLVSAAVTADESAEGMRESGVYNRNIWVLVASRRMSAYVDVFRLN